MESKYPEQGRAVAQAVSRRLPTATARVLARVRCRVVSATEPYGGILGVMCLR
jgi:hypothetical protein